MSWVFLVIAGIFEMLGVLTINLLNRSRSFRSFVLFFIAFGCSFLFLSLAMKTLPMGTAYAVWTGIGAAGGAVLGMILYNEPRNAMRIVCIALVLGCTVGLKLVGS